MSQPNTQDTLDRIFEQQVVATPDAIALAYGTERWTYQQLNGRANYVAHVLREHGVGPDQLIALVAGRSAETIAMILGILKAGGAYLPLSPSDPPARLAALLASAKPVLVLAEREFAAASNIPVIRFAEMAGSSAAVLQKRTTDSDLCYVMFSSGSTGTPKGVMVEHRSVIRLVKDTNYAEFSPEHTFLQFAPLAFDASTFEIWGALLNGGTLAIVPEGMTSLREIGAAIDQYQITTAWLTAGLFAAMVDQEIGSLCKLRQLLTGGDVVSPIHARRLLLAAPKLRLINGYGPTEATTFTCCYTIPEDHNPELPIPIGSPISKTRVHILDEDLQPLPNGAEGEICIGGEGVARGYLNDGELTAKHFVPDPFGGQRLYRSGDRGRIGGNGQVEFLGRVDAQVKLRGFRIDLSEIEGALAAQLGVAQATAIARNTNGGEKQLAAFVVRESAEHFDEAIMLRSLSAVLPPYAVPARIFALDKMPLTTNGKVDRKALLECWDANTTVARPPSASALESEIAAIWSSVLGIAVADLDRAFFDQGGSSLQLMQVHASLEKWMGREIVITDLFRFPTIRTLARFLSGMEASAISPVDVGAVKSNAVAIVGMAGRFPGARNVREFWNNLAQGVESTTWFDPATLDVPSSEGAVDAKPILDGAEMFDAAYFGILPKEAELIDPQQRVFLECCVEALNDAGCDPSNNPPHKRRDIGVFGGTSPNTYFLHHICAQPGFLDRYTSEFQVGNYATMLGTSPDFLTTRVSHKLNLTGPSITSGTACSTSLVAVAQACESLLHGNCDAALAGGVSITYPQRRGYQYQEGNIVSPDGRCRAFDKDAQGTIFGSGCGVVMLKRLDTALADGDHIYAVIRGVGINNDGATKAGFTAPSVEGQAAAIRKAHHAAGVNPETITYVEAHGTATPLGDPIEVAALTEAFRAGTERKHFCGLGTAKTNVGHLDAAAGVTGLIKAALSIEKALLPPVLHYREPNPRIDFANSPFFVVNELKQWEPEGFPRRAGVSSFGVGGTNVHMVLEQAPSTPETTPEPSPQVLILSAKTDSAALRMSAELADALEANPQLKLSDAAFMLQTGRSHWAHRRAVACKDRDDAIAVLRNLDSPRISRGVAQAKLPILFAFPGQGAQRAGMGRELYGSFSAFRAGFDICAEHFQAHAGEDLRAILFAPSPGDGNDNSNGKLDQTAYAQPALFAVSYALVQLWKSWGVQPDAMIGHSVGEFVAACEAGVFTPQQAMEVIALRGKLMQSLPAGAMLAVHADEQRLLPLLSENIALAAINSPAACTVAGSESAIKAFEALLSQKEIAHRRLRTSHAFHSPMMNPVIAPLADCIAGMRLGFPQKPFVSTLTGTWITAAQATDPAHWSRHCAETVRFSQALCTAQAEKPWLMIEAGAGRTLTTLALQHGQKPNPLVAIGSLGDPASTSETQSMLGALGRAWVAGVECDWKKVSENGGRKVSLPAYSFDKVRYCVERPAQNNQGPAVTSVPAASSMKESVKMQVSESEVSSSNQQAIRQELVRLFEELSGLDLQSAPAGSSFVDLGFDSLFLTQANQKIQSRYKMKIRFTELLGELNTFEALAARVAAASPSPNPPSPNPPSPNSPSATTVAAPATSAPELTRVPPSAVPLTSGNHGSALEHLLQQQLQAFQELTAKQLDVVRGMGPAPVATVAPLASPTQAPPSQPSVKPQESFGPFRPIQKSAGGEFTEQQERYLKAFAARYSRRTAESKKRTQQHRATLADPRVASGFRLQWKEIVYPISVARSEGSRLWDVDGNEYIDIQNGFGVTMFGHGADFVRQAVREQLEYGWEIGPQTPLAGDVAALLCEITGNQRATFCNTGSEAVMAAMRLARTVTGRDKIVYFIGDYHGSFDEVLLRRAGSQARPIAPGIPVSAAGNVLVLEYGSKESLSTIRQNADSIAAVMVEPVQSRHPALQPKAYLQELRQLTEEAGIALIFDEVVTGFRSHPGGAQAIFDVRADLVTYGKVVGGGMPIGVLAGKAQFMDALDGGHWQFGDESVPEAGVTFFAGTFVRHPLAMAAAWAVLNHLKQAGPQLQEELARQTTRLVEGINQLFAGEGLPVKCEHFASLFYFSFPPDQRFASLFYSHLRLRGVHILEGFPCFLTTSHTSEDIDQVLQAFRGSVADMQGGGLLPASPQRSSSETATAVIECPLTEAQMEIRLSAQLGDEESCAFNEGFTLTFDGKLNVSALTSALQTVIGRHEAFRSTLHPTGDRLLIHPSMQVPLTTEDLSSLEPAERAQRIRDLKERDAWRVFDLVQGPLLRTHLAKTAEDQHVLFVTAHHIICDGWSIAVALEETTKLYNAACSGQPSALPAPMPFTEYAQTADSQAASEVEEYWVSQFAEPSPTLELPTDRPRGAVKSNHGATYVTDLSADFRDQVQKAGAKNGCTPFVTLLAGFELLLRKLSGQSDVVVGIPSAGQADAGQDMDDRPLVGHCVNFLPIRVQTPADATFHSLLTDTRRQLLAAKDHSSYTYGTLVRKLAIPRHPGRLPLIEVQFNLERTGSQLAFDNLSTTMDQNQKRFVTFDLFLNLVESSTGIRVYCDYNTDLFDESTIASWIRQFENLFSTACLDVTRPLAHFNGTDSRDSAAEALTGLPLAFPELCAHQLFEQHAATQPHAIALRWGNESISYGDLNTRANQLAHALASQGAGPSTLIGLSLDPSMDMVTAVLAVMKTGAAYLPLDPSFPPERLAYIREDAKALLVLDQHNWPALIHSLDQSLDQQPGTALSTTVATDSLAYVIYTSGSTGRPKGVEIEHRALTNFLWSMKQTPGMNSSDHLLAVTTLSFDIAGLELFLPLICGAEVVIASRESKFDGRVLAQLIESAGITMLQATPTTWKMLLDAGWRGVKTQNGNSLKMLCGGEELTRELATRLLATTGTTLWNMYGPTETTIWSSCAQITQVDGPISIGSPIANTQLYVLNQHGKAVVDSTVGELYIGGTGLARGYRDRAELTRERFVNLFGQRLYRTGDLVRSLGDGTLTCLGRLDRQVKIRGHRIELGEIEEALLSHPKVRDAAVIVREDQKDDKRLVAYLVAADASTAVPSVNQASVNDKQLRSDLSVTLPVYMVPAHFVVLQALPLTANGKIDRMALTKLPAPSGAGAGSYREPATSSELALARIIQDVVGTKRVGLDDDFFTLGGDSIHLFQVAARAAREGIAITPKQLLNHRTIALTLAAAQKESSKAGPASSGITALRRELFRKEL